LPLSDIAVSNAAELILGVFLVCRQRFKEGALRQEAGKCSQRAEIMSCRYGFRLGTHDAVKVARHRGECARLEATIDQPVAQAAE